MSKQPSDSKQTNGKPAGATDADANRVDSLSPATGKGSAGGGKQTSK